MNKDIDNLQNWLDGKYVSPPEFKKSLTKVILKHKEYEKYFEENSVEAIERLMEPYYEELAKLINE